MKQTQYQVAIAGAGLAGSVAAYHLASRGFRVLLVDREPGPVGRICGEFFSGEGVNCLRDLGIDIISLGAQKISKLAWFGPERAAVFPLPTLGYGISRMRLDTAVLSLARRVGAELRWNCCLQSVDGPPRDFNLPLELQLSDRSVQAERLLLATGLSDVFIGQRKKVLSESLTGVKVHLRPKPSVYKRKQNNLSYYVGTFGYGTMVPLADGILSFCFVIKAQLWRDLGQDWKNLASLIAKTNWQASRDLDGAEPDLSTLVVGSAFARSLVYRRPSDPRIFRVGDQLAAVPSFIGDGQRSALDSGRAVVEFLESSLAGNLLNAQKDYFRRMYARIHLPNLLSQQVLRVFGPSRFANHLVRVAGRAPWAWAPLYFATRVGFGSGLRELAYLKSRSLDFQSRGW